MILTLTLNPAVDQTLWVERFVPGTVHRPTESQLDAAGKGVNVSRMAHRLGAPTIAFGFLGGETGHIVESLLDEERVQHHFVAVPGRTRIDVTIIDRASGEASSFFDAGPRVTSDRLRILEEMLEIWLGAARVLVLAGSLPPGADPSIYSRLVHRAHEHGVDTIVDADGEPLRDACSAAPTVIKPNRSEAERLLGRTIRDEAEAVAAARELSRRGAVVLSLGRQGAIVARRTEAWFVTPPPVPTRSTVGSGDSLVAGIAVALDRGEDLLTGVRLGTAAGAATAASPGTALGTAEETRRLFPQVRMRVAPDEDSMKNARV